MELNENYLKGIIDGIVALYRINGEFSTEQFNDLNAEWKFENVGKDKKVICEFTCAFNDIPRICSTDMGMECYMENEPERDNDYFIISEHESIEKFADYVNDIIIRLTEINF